MRGETLLGNSNTFGGPDELLLLSNGPVEENRSRSILIGPPTTRIRTHQPQRNELDSNPHPQNPIDGQLKLGPPPPPLEWIVDSWSSTGWEFSERRSGINLSKSMTALEEILPKLRGSPGTLCGAMAYDLVQWTQPWAMINPPEPMSLLGIMYPVERWIIHDREEGWLEAGARYDDDWLKALDVLLSSVDWDEIKLSPSSEIRGHSSEESSSCSDDEHAGIVRRVKQSIKAGQLYQLNFGRKWRGPLLDNPWDIQRRLLFSNPAPWSCYLHTPDLNFAICSSSPEMLIEGTRGKLCTAPIKGTKPRGNTPDEDIRLVKELLECPKERAEHLMLVDLERNDMTIFCKPGSVRRASFRIESYADVHHLVSEVKGTLREDRTIWDALQAMFPGGSISGCPKTVTIAAIDQLENEARSFWTGSVGIFDHIDRSMSVNILIRTLEAHRDDIGWKGIVQAGGGLVIGSEPYSEVEEAKWKASALRKAVGWISNSHEKTTKSNGNSVTKLELNCNDEDIESVIGKISEWPIINRTTNKLVAFIDNLDSFSWNIANALALEGADVVIVPGRGDAGASLDLVLEAAKPTHIVIGPGPGIPQNSELSMQAASRALDGKMPPLLGICLGHQAIGVSAGWPLIENRYGAVHGETHHIQPTSLNLSKSIGPVTRYHSLVLDPNDEQLESSKLQVGAYDADGLELIMAISHSDYPVYGVQYHPESAESRDGQELFRTFLNR